MKNVIKNILNYLYKFWDLILSIILFLFYIVLFLPYKLFYKEKKKNWWLKVDDYNFKNKNLPF